MELSMAEWSFRATMCELLALSFRYPKDTVLVEALTSGEWYDAADEIVRALDLPLSAGEYDAQAKAETVGADPEALTHLLRKEATRLFVGTPEAPISPYEGVWRAVKAGKAPLMFVGEDSMDVERFCKSCGLDHAGESNDPMDALWTELELMTYLSIRAATAQNETDVEGLLPAQDLPGGSAAAAWDMFVEKHAGVWMPGFADDVIERSDVAFYVAAACLLKAFVQSLKVQA